MAKLPYQLRCLKKKRRLLSNFSSIFSFFSKVFEFLHVNVNLIREHRSVIFSAGLPLIFKENKAKISSQPKKEAAEQTVWSEKEHSDVL